MMLVYDLRAMQILFHPPADAGSRERRTVTIARLITMIGEEVTAGRSWLKSLFIQLYY